MKMVKLVLGCTYQSDSLNGCSILNSIFHNLYLFYRDIVQTTQELSDEYRGELAKSPYKEPSRHAAFAYDAVWTIALTLNQSIAALKQQNETRNMSLEDFDYTNMAMRKAFMKIARGISFQGMSVGGILDLSLWSHFYMNNKRSECKVKK